MAYDTMVMALEDYAEGCETIAAQSDAENADQADQYENFRAEKLRRYTSKARELIADIQRQADEP